MRLSKFIIIIETLEEKEQTFFIHNNLEKDV